MQVSTRMAGASAVVLAVVSVGIVPTASVAAEVDPLFFKFQAEEFEYRLNDGDDSLNWDAQGWIGGDVNKIWLKTEGEYPFYEKLEEAEVQALYSRQISDFFDVQVGARYDFAPDPERAFAVFGVQGLAPYFFEVDAAAFVSDEGELSARFEAEYELLITQKLILQPAAEINLSAEDVDERGIGSGITDIELGLRLRYEIVRKFAPYIGVNWERKLGETEDLARAEGDDVDNFAVVAGLRFWF